MRFEELGDAFGVCRQGGEDELVARANEFAFLRDDEALALATSESDD